jgi:hypothetical protein
MIRLALLIICALILQNDLGAQPKIEKSSRVKFGGKMPFGNEPFIFESGGFTYVVSADYNSGASRLVFKMAKFNNKLRCIKKAKHKYKRNEGFYGVGYRYLQSGKYLSFFYTDKTQENTKIYVQKVNLENMNFEGKPRLLADLNSEDDYWDRKISCVKSPDGNFMLLIVDGNEIQAQYLFDNKENLIYVKRNELGGYALSVTNEGRVVGIKDEKTIDKKYGVIGLDFERPEGENRFVLLVMNKDGKSFYKNYTPEANIYHRRRQWVQYSSYSSYNSITRRMDIINNSTVKSVNQLSYQFRLRDNILYFVSFVTCESVNGIGTEYEGLTNAIFVSKFEVTDTLKNTGKSIYTFTKEQANSLLDQSFSFNKSTMSERIREIKDLNICDDNGFPVLYMDYVDVDDEGNLSVFGSSFVNNNVNIYTSRFKDEKAEFPYERRNYHYFKIDRREGLSEETATASILFEKDMFMQDGAFLRHSDKKGYSVANVYKLLELDLKKTNHDQSKKLKIKDGVGNYFIWSESGRLYQTKTKNMDVVLYLYRISS